MSKKQLLEMLDYLERAATIKPSGFVAPEVTIHNEHVRNFAGAIRDALMQANAGSVR